MPLKEIGIGYYFDLDGKSGLVPATEPLSVMVQTEGDNRNLPSLGESLRRFSREKASRIPPVPDGLPEPVFSPNSQRVLEARYLKKNEKGKVIETPGAMLLRVACNVAAAEELYGGDPDKTTREFYEIMANLEFLPNSPTLMNAGRDLQQLSACFVLPVEDSIDSIFDAVHETAKIHQSGGGTGFSFSRLRPEGDRVRTTGGVASGPVSFIRAFDTATDVIKQGGTRRGANMGILNVNHPDILKFITCKEKEGTIENFNISVAVTDEFMKAVAEDREYDLVNPRTGQATGRLRAKEVFDKIVEGTWRNGEPGVVFIDRINQHNPTPHLGRIESTNPCGEQPLLPYESCNLGSINLGQMVKDGQIDWQRLGTVVGVAVHFLDNVIDMNEFPHEKIAEATLKTRKIGLGVMGFAHMLIQLGISYDSEEGIKMAEMVMAKVDQEAFRASRELAHERGVFPSFKGSIYDSGDPELKVRHATRTTIAPTGTISIIANYSSGIEPLFAVKYEREVTGGGKLEYLDYLFERIARERGFYSEDLIRRISQGGSVQEILEVPEDVKRLFKIGTEIDPEWHVRMQAAFQKHTDNAVSKTINLPNTATTEDVSQAYSLAYELGCKGVTIYRNFSRERQVIQVGRKETMFIRPFPEVLEGKTRSIETGSGILEVTIKEDGEGNPFKVSAEIGKPGSDALAMTVAIANIISLGLRTTPPSQVLEKLRLVTEQLLEIGGSSSVGFGPERVLSISDAMGRIFNKYLEGRNGQQGEIQIRSLPKVRPGETRLIKTPSGTLHVTLNRDGAGGHVLEIFTQIGKGASEVLALTEGLARIISLELRTSPPSLTLEKLGLIRDELLEIGGSSSVGFGPERVVSIPDGLAQVIDQYLTEQLEGNGESLKRRENQGNFCPECHRLLIMEEGCKKCICGFSKC